MKSIYWGVLLLCISQMAFALTNEQKITLINGENETRIVALDQLALAADVSVIPFLQLVLNDEVRFKDGKVYESDAPDDAEYVINNNQIRAELDATIAALNLLSADAAIRAESAQSLLGSEPSLGRLSLIRRAEISDPEIQSIVAQVRASIEINSKDKTVRLAAIDLLLEEVSPNNKQILATRLEDGEADEEVRTALTQAIKKMDDKMALYENIGELFTGVSLGSILLLAALGLAVTYGLMGVINMAHGEMMMLGAYATFVTQTIFQQYFAELGEWYLFVAIPFAFVSTALIGMLMEKLVIRHLYGRPLETLLATWGVSLILMQAVRSVFGAQNVQVSNPDWMSGGLELTSSLILPYNRLYIIIFAALVLLMMWLILSKTRLGLFMRAVTQNRSMASCTGVNTGKVDALAFGLGSGIAGLAGVALSQVGNVGPALGQSYIVDSFMVVVLGGVGQLAGTVYAALGLGVTSKFLEGFTGAVLAKILVLVFIIIFIQKRPQGLFSLKGRSAD